MSNKSARAKGSLFQKVVMKAFAKAFDLVEEEDIRSSVGRETGADVKLVSLKAKDRVGLAIECKNSRTLNIFRAIEQARKYRTGALETEAVVFKKGSVGPNTTYICIPLDHYLRLRRRLYVEFD